MWQVDSGFEIVFQSSEPEVIIASLSKLFIDQLVGGQKLGENLAQLLKELSCSLIKAQAFHYLLVK